MGQRAPRRPRSAVSDFRSSGTGCCASTPAVLTVSWMASRQDNHAHQLGDLLSALSSLNEIPDLLEPFRSKLYLSSTSRELRGKLLSLHHFCIPSVTSFAFYADVNGGVSPRH